jgi:hypothetical protein
MDGDAGSYSSSFIFESVLRGGVMSVSPQGL